ncbi:uncharacterized protein [Euphorbia lathyris]|uniref:uncharacterized protein isoform X2 n=1 Tax=Euphorbia lathyris TaxID=212925 RepID=UPI003314294B
MNSLTFCLRRKKPQISMAMAIEEKKMDFLSEESMVEVKIEKLGFSEVWYVAKILKSYSDPKGRFMVEFQSDSNQRLTDIVDVSFIRPRPPTPAADQTYNRHDVVDAFCGNGWWKGVVSEVKSSGRYRVMFEKLPYQLNFSSADLRIHLVWSDGMWIRPPKQEIPNTEHCEKQSEHVDNTANHSKVVPETEESLSNHIKEFGKENSVISKSPSALTKSTDQVRDSILAKCLTCDSGANPPLNTGKNTSPNQQEAGPRNRMELSSKKRERELSAKATWQKVAAAENVTESTLAKCSTLDSGANLPLDKGKNTSPNHQEAGPENRMEQSSKKRIREMDAQVTGQKVAAAADQEEEDAEVFKQKKKKSRKHTVLFEIPPDKFDFCSANLRFQLVWRDGRWVRPPKSEILKTADCGKQSAANHSKVVPETEETLSNHAKKFGKENSVFSLAKCATNYWCANLPFNKRKNISRNHQEARAENRMEESSKTSENELNDQVTRQKVAAAGDEVKNHRLPFTKTSFAWNYIDSLEVFRILSTPHFTPLSELDEEIREGLAISHMLTFATLVEKASELEIEKPTSLFDSYLGALADLKMLGFDVKAVADTITELLSFKKRQEKLENRSGEIQEKIAECDGERAKLDEEINEIDKMISELEERRAMKVSRKTKEDSKSEFLQFNASSIKADLVLVKEKFKVKAAALGKQ